MWLVDRHSDGRGSGRIPLPSPVRDALVRWYVGDGSPGDEEAGITLVQQARIGEKWLACDCLDESALPPILTPAFLSEAETYYLRRLTSAKRPEHRSDCPFFRDQMTHRITEIRGRETPADPPVGYFEVLRPAPEKLAQRPEEDASDDRTRHASVPRLARLLWRLLEVSGRNRCGPVSAEAQDRSICDEFKAISAAASHIEIAPGVELGRALWTHGAALHSRRVYAALRALSHRWPNGHAPQAFLTLFAQNFHGQLVEAAGCEPVKVANRIQSPSVKGNPVKGPYLVIIVAGEYPEAHGYAPLRAYAQPIYSGQRFLPVDSEFERSLLKELLRARLYLDRRGIDVWIEKPVFDKLTPLGACRPDFMLEARSRSTGEVKRIVLDGMGFDDKDYHAVKVVTHPRMAQLAPVITIAPDDVAERRVGRILADALDL